MRLRNAMLRRIPQAMPADFNIRLAQFIDARRQLFTIGGDGGATRWNHEVLDVGNHFDLGEFHAMLVDAVDDDVLRELCVDPFDLGQIECHLTLYHHGAFFDWHDDWPGPDGRRVNTRRVTFNYYLLPVRGPDGAMFTGGQLEFMDGTKVVPEHGTLVLLNPDQKHRVAPVECWHGDWMHARFCLTGWLHAKQTTRHYWLDDAVLCGSEEGGNLTGWPQDVTCLECQTKMAEILSASTCKADGTR